MTLCPSPSQVYVPEQITGYGGGGGGNRSMERGDAISLGLSMAGGRGDLPAGGLGTGADLQGGAREPGKVYLCPRSIPSLKEDTINGT